MADLAPAVAAAGAGRTPSVIADHGADCCAVARAWLEGLDSTFHRGRARAAPPAWVAQRFALDATARPLHWCEIAPARTLGGGAVAALGRELWRRRCDGVRAVQLVVDLAPYRAAAGGREPAGERELAYREAIGRERDDRLEIWDCRDCSWLASPRRGSTSPTHGVRVTGGPPTTVRWGEHDLPTGVWTALG